MRLLNVLKRGFKFEVFYFSVKWNFRKYCQYVKKFLGTTNYPTEPRRFHYIHKNDYYLNYNKFRPPKKCYK